MSAGPARARPIRAMDLFCGAGGSSWGAQQAGAQIIAAFDCWALAGQNHTANFPHARFFEGRLETINVEAVARQIGPIDLLLASPECTNHSPAKGNKPRCEDSRNTAFQVVRFARVLRPRWIVVENVVGMRRWARYPEFKQQLEELGYRIREEVLNAADFGVPQTRRLAAIEPAVADHHQAGSVRGWSQCRRAAPCQEVGSQIKPLRRAGFVLGASLWNPNHNALARPREQDAILVANELSRRRLLHRLPGSPLELTELPAVAAPCKVATPTNANPIKFQALALELSQRNFQSVRGTDVLRPGKKPLLEREAIAEARRNLDSMRPQPQRARTCQQAAAPEAAGLLS